MSGGRKTRQDGVARRMLKRLLLLLLLAVVVRRLCYTYLPTVSGDDVGDPGGREQGVQHQHGQGGQAAERRYSQRLVHRAAHLQRGRVWVVRGLWAAMRDEARVVEGGSVTRVCRLLQWIAGSQHYTGTTTSSMIYHRAEKSRLNHEFGC